MSSNQGSGGGRYTGTADRADLNNHSNQCNPNHQEYRGYSGQYSGDTSKAGLDNHSSQMNPNNPQHQPRK